MHTSPNKINLVSNLEGGVLRLTHSPVDRPDSCILLSVCVFCLPVATIPSLWPIVFALVVSAKLKKLKGRAMTILPPMGTGLAVVRVRGAEATLRVPT